MSWKEVPINECGEPLVLVRGVGLWPSSEYYRRGIQGALPDIWLRQGAAGRLRIAAGLLPRGFSLILWDGWRPLEVQRELFRRYRNELQGRGLQGDELERETLRFVSLPSEDPASPSPHLTGGTIDLTLGDEHGEPLGMGGEFDELGPRSAALFYEASDSVFRDRRRLLRQVMTAAGWTPYPEEWWHFDSGNQFDGHRRGRHAIYGPAKID